MTMTSHPHAQDLDDDTRAQLIAILRQYGVRHASLFGSFARGEQGPESDIDLLIEPPADATLFTLARLCDALEAVTGRSVDLITVNALQTSAHPRLRERILADVQELFT